MAKVRMVIVDNREVVRQGLAGLLGAEPSFDVVSTAGTVWDVVKKCGKHQLDVIFISSSLSECGGAEAICYVHDRLPKANIIVTVDSETDDDLISAVRAGVRAYLSPNIRADSLIQAITLVSEGKLIVSPRYQRGYLQCSVHYTGIAIE